MNNSANFSGQPIFKQILSFIHRGLIYRTAHKHGSDRYYKSFKTYNHLVTMLFATVEGEFTARTLRGDAACQIKGLYTTAQMGLLEHGLHQMVQSNQLHQSVQFRPY